MIVIAVFVITMIIGLPIAYVLGLAGLTHITVMGNNLLWTTVSEKMFGAGNNFSLLAIPMFVLVGELMGYGGITGRLVQFARAVLGHIRGGLAYVTVIVGVFLGALLGSANAEAALLGSTVYSELREDNYSVEFANCLIAAVSILGPIIPPSMIFIVYGVSAGVSVGELFFGGIIPGLLLALAYSIKIFLTARRKSTNWKVRERLSFKDVMIGFLKAAPSLTIPVVILGGILFAITSPTESAATATAMAIILGGVIYKKLKLKDLPKALLRTGVVTGGIMLIVAMANILGWTLALDQVPQTITETILGLTNSRVIFLLLINLLLLFVGCVMETVAAIIILVPVLLPAAQNFGVDPIHFGMIVSVNLVIGLLTPPIGIGLFTTSIVTGTPINRLIKPVWAWVAIAVLVLMFITYVPASVTFLPNLLFDKN